MRKLIFTNSIVLLGLLNQSCGLLSKDKGASTASFNSGGDFLAHVAKGNETEKNNLFQAFSKAGIPLPEALSKTLAGDVVLNTGESEARAAVKNSAGGHNDVFHDAGVPRDVPLVSKTERQVGKTFKLAINDDVVNKNVAGDVDVEVGNDNNNPAQCQARVSCFASASATAAAFACAFAEAWACVYSSVPPFGRLCTWARSQACAAAFVSVYSETYVEAFVNVCQGCAGGNGNDDGNQDDDGDDGSQPTATPVP